MSKKSRKKRIQIAGPQETERFGAPAAGAAPKPAADQDDTGNTAPAPQAGGTTPAPESEGTAPAPASGRSAPASGRTSPARTSDTDETTALRAELADVKDKLLRARAEQQNLIKRNANELSEAVRYANASLIRELLETIDDFNRMEDQSVAADVDTVLEGVRLIRDNFMKVLERRGLACIDAQGRPFDPRCHEAMMQRPDDGTEPGTVIEVLQRGYRLGERVLRPAKVVVAAAPEAPAAGAPADQPGSETVERACGAKPSEPVREER